jgi:hypothetical protein
MAATNATSSSALVLEWSGAPSHKFVQPGCTVAAQRNPASRLIASVKTNMVKIDANP